MRGGPGSAPTTGVHLEEATMAIEGTGHGVMGSVDILCTILYICTVGSQQKRILWCFDVFFLTLALRKIEKCLS